MPAQGLGNMNNQDIKSQMDMINNMGSSELDGMLNMMKSNPALVRQQYETMYGMKFTDE